jgi:hypothetical protein
MLFFPKTFMALGSHFHPNPPQPRPNHILSLSLSLSLSLIDRRTILRDTEVLASGLKLSISKFLKTFEIAVFSSRVQWFNLCFYQVV